MGFPVQVYIYEVSRGMARSMSNLLLGRLIEGVWHTGIVVYGKEYFYGGGGITFCTPGQLFIGQPDEVAPLGETEIPEDMFEEFLIELSEGPFKGEHYHLLEHNCNHFSNEVAQFLTGNAIPEKITSLPLEFMNTPFGQMIRPFIDEMMGVVNTGATVLPKVSTQKFGQPLDAVIAVRSASCDGGETSAAAAAAGSSVVATSSEQAEVVRTDLAFIKTDGETVKLDRSTKTVETKIEVESTVPISGHATSAVEKSITTKAASGNNNIVEDKGIATTVNGSEAGQNASKLGTSATKSDIDSKTLSGHLDLD